MVTRYWHGEDPIGRRLQVKGRWARVVGVAADSKYESMRETPKPFFYVPLLQDFVLRPGLIYPSPQPLQSISAALLREVHALDANLALYEMITLQEQVNRSTSPQLVAVDPGFDLRRIGASPRCRRPLWSHVLCRGAKHPRTWTAHGSWRRRSRSVSSGHFARLEINCGRSPLRRDCRSCIDSIIRKASLQREPERPAGIRLGIGSDDDHLSLSLPFACLARRAYRPSPSLARLILVCASAYGGRSRAQPRRHSPARTLPYLFRPRATASLASLSAVRRRSVSRLSHNCLPLAKASSTFTLPFLK